MVNVLTALSSHSLSRSLTFQADAKYVSSRVNIAIMQRSAVSTYPTSHSERVYAFRAAVGGVEGMVLHPVSEIRELDALVHKLGIEDSHITPCEAVDERLRDFARAILHGDDVHKDWLLEAVEAFIKGEPIPPPRDAKAALSQPVMADGWKMVPVEEPTEADQQKVDRAMDWVDAEADKWAVEVKLPEIIKNLSAVTTLTPKAPQKVKDDFRARLEQNIDALVRQTFLEAWIRSHDSYKAHLSASPVIAVDRREVLEEAAVERVARAIAIASNAPDSGAWPIYEKHARAALAVMAPAGGEGS